MTAPVSHDVVVLVDEQGRVLGQCDKLEVHQPPGRLHLAFSVLLYRSDGALLLQQRASGKYHFPLAWANVCCSHPAPGEPVARVAAARLQEELGVRATLAAVGSFVYRATCPSSGLVEHELDHVFVGTLTDEVVRNPAEVADVAFVAPDVLLAGGFPGELAPWLIPALHLAERYRGARHTGV